MRQAWAMPPDLVEKLKPALKSARTRAQFERVLCLWLRGSLRLNSKQVATAIGWSLTAVRNLQQQYLREGESVLKNPGRGGRRNEHLSPEAERNLLDRLRDETGPDGLLKAGAIHLAYEQAAGESVPKSTIYRMLVRHGWRRSAVGIVQPKKKRSFF